MTSAAKLYIWRSRAGTGRSSDPAAAAADPLLDSDLRRPRHRHGHGSRFHQREDAEHLHRSLSGSGQVHGRSFCHRASQSASEHESVRLHRRSSNDFDSNNGNNDEVTVRLASGFRNDRLPESVLQARERLVERLRGVSLAGTRETATTSSAFSADESAANHELNNSDLVHTGGETQSDRFNLNPQIIDYNVSETRKNLSGVSWESLCTLRLEVYRNTEVDTVSETRTPADCCICLESFLDGDGLIRLGCGHRFHCTCLEPWVRACNDCPYCRAKISCPDYG